MTPPLTSPALKAASMDEPAAIHRELHTSNERCVFRQQKGDYGSDLTGGSQTRNQHPRPEESERFLGLQIRAREVCCHRTRSHGIDPNILRSQFVSESLGEHADPALG